MIVDDQDDFLKLSKSYLSRLGKEKYLIDTLTDPQVLLDNNILKSFDLIISDFEMPEMSGLELLQEIRAISKEVPFILFTGKSREEVAIKALNLGVNYYITKGIDAESQYRELSHAIDSTVNQKRTESALKESEEKFRELFEDTPAPSYEWDVSEAKILIEEIKKQFPHTYKEEIMKFKNYYEITKSMKVLRINKAGLARINSLSLEEYNNQRLEAIKSDFHNNKVHAYDMIHYIVENIPSLEFETRVEDDTSEYWRVNIFVPQLNRKKFDIVWISITDISQSVVNQKKIIENEEKNRAILEAIPDLLFELDKNGVHLSFKGSVNQLYKKPKEFLGKSVFETLPKSVADLYINQIRNTLDDGGISIFRYSLPFETGKRHYESRMTKISSEKVLVVVRDITEQELNLQKLRQAYEKISESEKKYQNLTDNIPAVAWVTDEKGNTIFISSNVTRIYGYTPEEIITGGEELWFGRIHPEDLDRVIKHYNALFSNQGDFNIEYRIKRKDGKWIWLQDKATTIDQHNGRNVAYGVFMDITDRKNLQLQNQAILNAIPDMVFRLDRATKILSFRGSEKSLYLPLNEFLGKSCFDVLPKDVAFTYQKNITRSLKSPSKIVTFEYTLLIKDQLHYFEARMVNSGVNEVLAVVRDVTENIIDKERLKESKWKFEELFSRTTIPQAIRDFSEIKIHLNILKQKGIQNLEKYFSQNPEELYVVLKKGKLIDVNEAAVKFLDREYKQDFETLTKTNDPEIFPNYVESTIKMLQEIHDNKSQFSVLFKILTKDGSERLVEAMYIVPEEYLENYAWVWVRHIDITELESSKRMLRENKLKYEIAFELVDDSVSILERDLFLECNIATVKLLGYKSKDQILGKSILDFAPLKQPDGQHSFSKLVEKISLVYLEEEQKFLFRFSKADKKVFDAEMKLKKIDLGEKETLLSVIRPYDFKY